LQKPRLNFTDDLADWAFNLSHKWQAFVVSGETDVIRGLKSNDGSVNARFREPFCHEIRHACPESQNRSCMTGKRLLQYFTNSKILCLLPYSVLRNIKATNKGCSSVNADQRKILIYFHNTNHAILNSTFELVNTSCSHFTLLTNCS